MEIRAAEISKILKDQIDNFGAEADVAEVGSVLSVGDGVARVYGLEMFRRVKWSNFPAEWVWLRTQSDNVGVASST